MTVDGGDIGMVWRSGMACTYYRDAGDEMMTGIERVVEGGYKKDRLKNTERYRWRDRLRDRWRDRGMDRKREMDGKNGEGIEGAQEEMERG